MKAIFFTLAVLFTAFVAMGSSTRYVEADLFRNPARTLTWTPPSIVDTLAGVSSTQTLTNKTLTSPVINSPVISSGTASSTTFIGGNVSNTTIVGSNTLSGSIVGGTLSTNTLHNATVSSTVTLADQGSAPSSPAAGYKVFYGKAAGLFYKESGGTEYQISTTAGTGSFQDSTFDIYDNGDPTKKLAFQVSGVTAGTTRTLTAPDANTTIVGTDATQTLTNKTLTSPTIDGATVSGTINVNQDLIFASGKGLDFSATTSGTGTVNSNILKEYEAGSCTATIAGTGAAGSGTYTIRQCKYVRVGQLVTYSVYIGISAHTGTANISYTALPWAAQASHYAGCAIGYLSLLTHTGADYQSSIYVSANSAIAYHYQYADAVATTPVAMDTAYEIVFTCSYLAND